MSKLNLEQKEYLKTLDSKSLTKRTKKAFKISNEENEILNSKKLLKKFIKSICPK